MELKGLGKGYLDNVKETLGNLNVDKIITKKDNVQSNFNVVKDSVTITKKYEEKMENLKKLKELIEDLKNTELIKNRESLSNYSLEVASNSANVSFSIKNSSILKEGNYNIRVVSTPKSMIIASADINTDKALNLEGRLTVNGTNISIQNSDTLYSIKNKLNLGEDLNYNSKLDIGEDLDNNGELLIYSDFSTKSFTESSKLFIETKSKGKGNDISLAGSTEEIVNKLGFVDADNNLNVIQESSNGKIEINGTTYEVSSDNKIEIEGIEIDISSALEHSESSINIKYDSEKAIRVLNEFKEKYNKLIDFINNTMKNEDIEIKNLKYKLGLNESDISGIKVKGGPLLFTNVKSELGELINNNLQSAGFISNNEGKIEFDFDKIKKDLNSFIDSMKNSEGKNFLDKLEKDLDSYTQKVNVLDIKKESAKNILGELEKTTTKKNNIEEVIKENRKMWEMLSNKIKELDIEDVSRVMRNKNVVNSGNAGNNSNIGNHGHTGNNGNSGNTGNIGNHGNNNNNNNGRGNAYGRV